MTVRFWSFKDLIFVAKEAGLPSVTSMTWIVGCFWSRANSWALSLGIRFINTPCWWSIYKFDKNVFGMVEGLLRKGYWGRWWVHPLFASSIRTCFAHVSLWSDLQGHESLEHNHFLIWLASGPIEVVGSNHVCFPVKVISLYPYRTFTVFLG